MNNLDAFDFHARTAGQALYNNELDQARTSLGVLIGLLIAVADDDSRNALVRASLDVATASPQDLDGMLSWLVRGHTF